MRCRMFSGYGNDHSAASAVQKYGRIIFGNNQGAYAMAQGAAGIQQLVITQDFRDSRDAEFSNVQLRLEGFPVQCFHIVDNRYKLLTEKNIIVYKNNEYFTVKLPLVNPQL